MPNSDSEQHKTSGQARPQASGGDAHDHRSGDHGAGGAQDAAKSRSIGWIVALIIAVMVVLGIVYWQHSRGDDADISAGEAAQAEGGASGAGADDASVAGGTEAPVAGPQRNILAFGDSLFAGYNVAENESYPAQLQSNLRKRGINAQVTDAGVSGDTTAAGRQRLAFTLDAQTAKPDLVIVELGGNDLLRGIPPAQTRANLDAIMQELKSRGIDVLLMGMRAPPNLGPEFQQQFDSIYPDLARKYNAKLVPFLLESVYDKPQLIQSDRVHPTAQGITAMVDATAGDVVGALPPAAAASSTGGGGN